MKSTSSMKSALTWPFHTQFEIEMCSLSCNASRLLFIVIESLFKIANGVYQLSSGFLCRTAPAGPYWERERSSVLSSVAGNWRIEFPCWLVQGDTSPAQARTRARTKSSLSADGIQTKELEFYRDQAAISFAVLFIVLRAAQRRWVSVFSLYFGNLLNILGARQVLLIVWASILMTTLPLFAE